MFNSFNQTAPDTRQGKIISINQLQKFGFIQPFQTFALDDNERVIFQLRDVVKGQRISEHDQVEFELVYLDCRHMAKHVRLLQPRSGNQFKPNPSRAPDEQLQQNLDVGRRRQRSASCRRQGNVASLSVKTDIPDLRDVVVQNPNESTERSTAQRNVQKLFQGNKSKRNDNNKGGLKVPRFSLTGRVVSMQSNFGFIQPLVDLPEDYPKGKQIYFSSGYAKTGGLLLKSGDILAFHLGTKDISKPRAQNVRLQRPVARSSAEIEELLVNISQTLEKSTMRSPSTNSTRKAAEPMARLGDDSSDDEETEQDASLKQGSCLLNCLTCTALWTAVGNCNEPSHQVMDLLLDILLQLNDLSASMYHNFKSALLALANTRMFNGNIGSLRLYIEQLIKGKKTPLLIKVRKVLLLLLQYIPEKTHSIMALIKSMVSRDTNSMEHFLFKAMKEIARQHCDDSDDMEWNDLPLVPTTTELTGEYQEYLANLRPVHDKGAYESAQEYLDVYFRLLRADCFSSLCKHIQKLLLGKLDHRDMNVYHSVHLAGISTASSDGGMAVMLHVTPCVPVNNWATSSKLMFGNLICISPSGSFKDVIWATVINRDLEMLKKKQCISVELCSIHNQHSDAESIILMMLAGKNMIVVESPTYYLAYKPVLKKLQDIHPDEVPFQSELIAVKQCKNKPKYVSTHIQDLKKPIYDEYDECERSATVSHKDFIDSISGTWPKTLDKYQKIALEDIFLNRIACVQGPPGTGKTFIGIAVVHTILSMARRPEGPILILTYKNHALDEFLKELLVHYPGEVSRIGGRSKEPELASCNLNEMKKSVRKEWLLNDELNDKRNEIEVAMRTLNSSAKFVDQSILITAETFLKFLTKRQLINLLFGCNWSGLSNTVLTPESVTNGFLQSNQSAVEFFRSDKMRMNLLNYAVMQWKPKASECEQEQKKHISSLHSYLTKNEKQPTALSASKVETDEMLDEKDIDDIQSERLAAASHKTIRGNGIQVDFRGTQISANLLGHTDLNELSFDRISLESDLWSMPLERRLDLMRYMMLKQLENPSNAFEDDLLYYQQLCAEKRELDDQHKIRVMKTMKVIGMTITGASINAHLLAAVKPAIVLVEEAAEVLEPQLIATLGSWVEHLILIGDHKQLRPPVENFALVSQFHFDISMMERLINNNLPYNCLAVQNRMRPEFSSLLLDIYPELKDSRRVHSNEPAVCVDKSMFFWQHTDVEEHSRSFSNKKEADRVVKLALFLVQQGYTPDRITVLAAYQGQVALLRQKFAEAKTKWKDIFPLETEQAYDHSKHGAFSLAAQKNTEQQVEKKLSLFKVHTIDMYQGDENDFVIVSLVRSNPKKAVGFLKQLNRRCVAQSRSRCGLYFVGNAETLSENVHWTNLIQNMRKAECVGTEIKLKCPKHPTSTITAKNAEDITLGTFCKINCGEIMNCGKHMCPKSCQPPHGHSRCEAIVEFIQPCGHKAAKQCHQDKKDIRCKFACTKSMPCGQHPCHNKCMPEHAHTFCIEKVKFTCLKCGKENERMCSDPESSVRCEGEIKFTPVDCGHTTTRSCYESEGTCREACTRTLQECGHPCGMRCGDACNPAACKICKRIEKEKKKLEEARLKQQILDTIEKELSELRESAVTDNYSMIPLSASDDDTSLEYFKIEDMVTKYIQPLHGWKPKVLSIEKVSNPKLTECYLLRKQQLIDPGVEELKFHGTNAWDAICKEGFRMPQHAGMFGKGIYFATDSSKSAQEMYTKGSNTLLLCQVALGRAFVVNKQRRDMTQAELDILKYDSVYAKRDTRATRGVLFDEFIVYRADQGIPKYVIRYETVEV